MSNSEFHQMAKGKWEPSKPKMAENCSADLAFVPNNEFVELLWENGQIVMQGQNNRNKKVSVPAGFSSNPTSNGEDAVIPIPAKGAKFGTAEVVAQDFSSSAPATVGVVQDDELVPWVNYPFDYSLEKEYCSDFFSELSGMNRISMPASSNAICSEKTDNLGNSQAVSAQNGANMEQGNSYKESVLESDINAAGRAPARVRGGQFFHSSQFQGSAHGVKGKLVDFGGSDDFQASACENSTPSPASVVMAQTMKIAPSPVRLSRHISNASVMNFSHFSRPAVLAKNNLQSAGMGAGLSTVDPFRSTNNGSHAETNPIESSVVDSTSGSKQIGGCKKVLNFQGRPPSLLSKTENNLPAKLPVQEPRHNHENGLSREDGSICRNRSPDQTVSQSLSFAASTELGISDSRKAFEPVVASSSVCSGSSAERTPKNSKHRSKRKSTELEESGYRSEDAEEESVDVRKATTSKSTNAKRSRAAEVHNLSERRRRDRINEKMRALQELIPNCNKADKASMLDEAIEYLKTLQLQVQIMSMGSGMCMPPMMVPAGMRHMHAPHMAHFPPVGVGMGMGMGMGFGMGMLDMGCSSACPMIPMPQMHGPQLPCPSLSGSASLVGMPGFNVPMFGIPGQGLPMTMPRGPILPYSGLSLKVASAPETSATVTTVPGSVSALPSMQKNQLQNGNSASVHGNSGQQTQATQGTKGCFSQTAAMTTTHQAGSSSDNAVLHTTKTDGVPTNATCCD